MTGWTEEGLTRAWRALSRQEAGEDWRFVHLARMGAIAIEAGCHFPAGREALIVSFPGSSPLTSGQLPEGKGFDVAIIEGQQAFRDRTAVALVRRPEGSPDIFTIIVVDVLRTLEAAARETHRDVISSFLERLREWQAFMARTHRPLSPDAQVGLMGELWMLSVLADSTLGPAALGCWQGPLKAAHDFHPRSGAIEVKSTTRKGAFLARINSIEQLDTDRTPMFLCALRFEEAERGVSLVDMITELRARFAEAGTLRAFDGLLLVMGYLDEHAPLYGRRLTLGEARAFRVEGEMPRLTRAALPPAVRTASYVLDLDALDTAAVDIPNLLTTFGLDRHEP